jgi:hypothetical protein
MKNNNYNINLGEIKGRRVATLPYLSSPYIHIAQSPAVG